MTVLSFSVLLCAVVTTVIALPAHDFPPEHRPYHRVMQAKEYLPQMQSRRVVVQGTSCYCDTTCTRYGDCCDGCSTLECTCESLCAVDGSCCVGCNAQCYCDSLCESHNDCCYHCTNGVAIERTSLQQVTTVPRVQQQCGPDCTDCLANACYGCNFIQGLVHSQQQCDINTCTQCLLRDCQCLNSERKAFASDQRAGGVGIGRRPPRY